MEITMEDKVKLAIKNLDTIASKVSLSRAEHLQLVADLEVIQTVCKDYFELVASKKEEVPEKKEEDDGGTD